MNKERLFRNNMVFEKPSNYAFKPATQTLQQNSIQQGFSLGIKHRNQFDTINGKMNMTNKK
jgi:hypothetical protein